MCFILSQAFHIHFPLHFTVIFVQFNSIPIFLTGLPPQGFRRLWKARENSSTEKLTKVNSMTEA